MDTSCNSKSAGILAVTEIYLLGMVITRRSKVSSPPTLKMKMSQYIFSLFGLNMKIFPFNIW